jgi:hypothetical protein
VDGQLDGGSVGVTQERQVGRLTLTVVASLLVVIGVPSMASAEAESLYSRFTRDVWFVGFGGALGISNFDDYDSGDITGGPTLRVGNRPYRSFAWEVEADYFVNFEDGNARPLLATANARWMIPHRWVIPESVDANGRWQPFLLGGAGWIQARQTENGEFDKLDSAVFRLGAGIELYSSLDTAWRLDAQYMIPVGDASDLQFAAVLVTVQLY